MTERLYYHDATLLSFEAMAVAHADDPCRVILDRTAFYPTSGGQPHDLGTLGGVPVLDVIDDDDQVIHVTAHPVPLGAVRGSVDAARRRDHMQQHTAQHLLSAIAADRLQWGTVSVHFGDVHSTIEFDVDDAPPAQLRALERWANEAVMAAHAVTVSFEPADSARSLRKPPPRGGIIRIVTIADLDRSACGGTHVESTAAIGPVLLRDVERVRGRIRVMFLAGWRTLGHLHHRDTLVHTLADAASCAVDELIELVPRRQQELVAAVHRIEQLERELAIVRVQAMVAAVTPGVDGVRRVMPLSDGESVSMLRAMANAAATLERVLFIAIAVAPPSIVVGTSADSGVDAGARLKTALAACGGRGGGSPRFAQGTAPGADCLRDAAARVAEPLM